jgi:hypothetical protein
VLKGKKAKAQDFAQHASQLVQTWHDTLGGKASPTRPW